MACPSRLSFILYNPIRKILQDRDRIIEQSCVTSTSIVLEIGAGNGFLTEALAAKAKKVYAVELQAGMARKLQNRVRSFGERVEIVQADIADYSHEKELADICILLYSFHEIRNKAAAARNISAAVKANGLLSIYEPTIEVGRKRMQDTVDLFSIEGFSVDFSKDNFFTRFVRLRKGR
jgi:tRNA A58 N-methylase Trm61